MSKSGDMEDIAATGCAAAIISCLAPVFMLLDIALGVYAAFAFGYAVHVLWGWFAVPEGLPVLSFKLAAGIFIIRPLISGTRISSKTEPAELVVSTLFAMARPWLAIGIGWIVLKVLA